MQVLVREWVGSQLIAQEVADNLFGILNRIDGHVFPSNTEAGCNLKSAGELTHSVIVSGPNWKILCKQLQTTVRSHPPKVIIAGEQLRFDSDRHGGDQAVYRGCRNARLMT